MYEKHTDQLLRSPSEEITMKGKTKYEDKEHEKTLKHEAPRSIKHKAT